MLAHSQCKRLSTVGVNEMEPNRRQIEKSDECILVSVFTACFVDGRPPVRRIEPCYEVQYKPSRKLNLRRAVSHENRGGLPSFTSFIRIFHRTLQPQATEMFRNSFRGNRGNRGGWTGRARTASPSPAPPFGPLIENVAKDSLDSDEFDHPGPLVISDVRSIASYNWVNASGPRIMIPGMNPLKLRSPGEEDLLT